MTHTLVSFLGRVSRARDSGEYRTATYRFADGTEVTTSFFGLALTGQIRPDRLVLLGTRGSMWDVLVEHLAASDEEEDVRLKLLEAGEAKQVSTELLKAAAPLVERALGLPCTLQLIPYGRDSGEQQIILSRIEDAVPPGRVTLDLTHGFRHLAALGLLSGFFLERIAHLQIGGLYYGALDMTEHGITPVVRLDGLLAIQRWIDALDRFDQNGDYGVFAALLEADGLPLHLSRCLTDASFNERTMNLADARAKLQTFLPALESSLPGVSGVFQNQLKKRLDWVRTGGLFEHQARLARFYLDSADYVRAAIFAYEAVITRECRRSGGNLHQFDDRSEVARAFEEGLCGARGERHFANLPAVCAAFLKLKAVRNALAHGDPPKLRKFQEIIANPERLPRELRTAIKNLKI